MKFKLEYIWLDGYEPVPNLRSKTKIVDFETEPTLDQLPLWNFDGSSTRQADGSSSDCFLQPVALFPDPARNHGLPRHVRGAAARRNAASVEQPRRDHATTPTPGSASSRSTSSTRTARRSGSRRRASPPRRASTTPASASRTSGDVARQIVDEHIDLCIEAGIGIEGVNAEVAKGQWEFQIFGKGAKRAADELWIARYLMLRLCERYGVDVNFHPKPLGADVDWNGSGLHTNFSTKHMREVGGEEYFTALMSAFSDAREEHIACYGPENDLRLTGLHETAAIDEFTYGVADRGASVRIPHSFVEAATAAISRIAGRTRWPTRTASPAGSCRRSSRSPRRR